MRNQELSAQERAFALEELKRAQEIASGEREEELIRFYETGQKKTSKNFIFLNGSSPPGLPRRARIRLGIRNRLLQRMDELSQTAQMDKVAYGPALAQVDQRDIMSEALRRDAVC